MYDATVIGAGPAGLTASLFLSRHGRSVRLIDELLGNHMTNAGRVENFPGFPSGIEGPELWATLQQQAIDAGASFSAATVDRITPAGGSFRIATGVGEEESRSVVVCVGSKLRSIGADGEERLVGRGLSHCASCDGPLFAGRDVAVVGGGDAAVDSALILSSFVDSVTVVHRGQALRAQHVLRDRLEQTENVRVLLETEVVGMEGDATLEALVLRGSSGALSRLEVGGVFVLVGLQPSTEFLQDIVELDSGGHVVTDRWLKTSVPGIFAAGDVRVDSSRQFASACGDGATAALAAHRFLQLDAA